MTERETLPQSAIVPASDYVIIGGTGDLSLRKIFPALFLRYAAGQVTNDFRLFVVSRQEVNANEFRERLKPHCASSISGLDGRAGLIDQFMELVEFACIDISQPMSMAGLAEILLPLESEGRPIIFYLSIASSLFSAACQRILKLVVLPQTDLLSKSRSATIAPHQWKLTMNCSQCSEKTRSTGLTIILARKLSRTLWPCALPM